MNPDAADCQPPDYLEEYAIVVLAVRALHQYIALESARLTYLHALSGEPD